MEFSVSDLGVYVLEPGFALPIPIVAICAEK